MTGYVTLGGGVRLVAIGPSPKVGVPHLGGTSSWGVRYLGGVTSSMLKCTSFKGCTSFGGYVSCEEGMSPKVGSVSSSGGYVT